MAKSQILWTILPYGMQDNYRRVSVVVSPRLTPESEKEETLKAFNDFQNWPDTILNHATFSAEIDGELIPLKLVSEPNPKLWEKLFPLETYVEGFEYTDMSGVNLRSYPIRGILGYLKGLYSELAVKSPLDYPRLLPWGDDTTDPGLKKMLEDAGVRTEKRDVLPGFDRFFDKAFDQPRFGLSMDVPAPGVGDNELPETDAMDLRVLDPDWQAHKDRFRSAFEYDLYQADRFYRRERPTEAELMMRRPDFKKIPDPPVTPDFDFHRIVASLASYPELMRQLGLVLDFILVEQKTTERTPTLISQPGSGGIIPRLPIDAGRIVNGLIQLKIKWDVKRAPDEDVTPRTAFFYDQERFITRSRTEDIKNGVLNLEHSGDSYDRDSGVLFDVYQVDPDGAALKTVATILTDYNLISGDLRAGAMKSGVTYTTGDLQGVAALRSGGLGVSRNERALRVAVDAAAATRKNKSIDNGRGNEITLYADDVFRGYRVDVATVPDAASPGVWRTLCARVGEYRLIKKNEKLDLAPDEGYVSGVSTTSGGPESSNPDDHYLHESLFRWTGWSLCTPRPGPVIVSGEAGDSHIQSEAPGTIDDVAENGSGVSATFVTEKGTLPRLRYGRMYRFRARIVDLAGNSFSLDDPALDSFTGASDAVGYWRFEPLDPPVVIHRARVSEGESLERMVIRSNFDVGADTYLAQAPFSEAIRLYPASYDYSYSAVNERHFVPPKSSQQQCETHGLFDRFFGDWNDIRKGYEIAARDELTLNDKLEYAYSDIEFVTPSTLSGIATTEEAPRPPGEDNPTGDRLSGGQYVIHKEGQIITPYLPDGAAGGIAIRAAAGHNLPGVSREITLGPSCSIKKMPFNTVKKEEIFVILVTNKGDWPELLGFRLILAEVKPRLDPSEFSFADEPVWDEQNRTLTLYVPKGWIVRLLYSSYVKKDYIDSFGILHWIDDSEKREFARDLASLYGANWLITPFRDLTLVHATQQPVFLPEFTAQLVLERKLGSHDVEFHSNTCVHLHGPSTGKFEVEADWSEWLDDPEKDTPEVVLFKGQLGEIQLSENHSDTFNLAEVIHAQQMEANAENPDSGAQLRGNVHALGDTRSRLIRYSIRATTRFREYLPPSIYDEQDLVTRVGPVAIGPNVLAPTHDPNNPDPGAPVILDPAGGNQQSLVLASAPPADPRVLYVVPTMRWGGKQENADGYEVVRTGNGLRVWLDRPWFSSGDGELLGVVIYQNNGPFTAIPKAFANFVTQWGSDPFWKSYPSQQQAGIADFPAAVTSLSGVTPEEVKLQETSESSNTKVMVIGHRVHFDYDRKLWYCDIELSPNLATYMPFVRLALVRYQPNAIDAAKVSKVVLTDFAQVLPNRSVSVSVDDKRGEITVSLVGPAPNSGPMSNENPYMPDKSFTPDGHIVQRDSGRNRVELVLQTRDKAIDSDLAWTDVEISGLFRSTTENILNDLILWRAVVDLTKVRSNRLQRLMLREFEQFYSDDVAYPSTRRVIEERLVFSYVIEV